MDRKRRRIIADTNAYFNGKADTQFYTQRNTAAYSHSKGSPHAAASSNIAALRAYLDKYQNYSIT